MRQSRASVNAPKIEGEWSRNAILEARPLGKTNSANLGGQNGSRTGKMRGRVPSVVLPRILHSVLVIRAFFELTSLYHIPYTHSQTEKPESSVFLYYFELGLCNQSINRSFR